MTDQLLQIGVGGSVAWLIIKEVLGFLRAKREEQPRPQKENSNNFTDRSDYWRNMDAAIERGNKVLGDILERQTKILEKMADAASEERGWRSARDTRQRR